MCFNHYGRRIYKYDFLESEVEELLEVKIKLPNVNDAALFCAKCGEFEEDVDYVCGRYKVDAKSLMGILSVSLNRICTVILHTDDENTKNKLLKSIKFWIVEEDK